MIRMTKKKKRINEVLTIWRIIIITIETVNSLQFTSCKHRQIIHGTLVEDIIFFRNFDYILQKRIKSDQLE